MTDVKAFCKALPKIELHAHLNTSFSKGTMEKLVKRKLKQNPAFKHSKLMFQEHETGRLEDHFEIYRQLHTVCNDAEAIYILTYDIIHEFAKDNVKYLEIRSTPKEVAETGLTFDIYIGQMVKAMTDCEKEGLDIIVRIILSIDRRKGIDVGYKTVELAEKWRNDTNGMICGIDFSGDPALGNAEDYVPVLESASKKGLKVTVHLAEIPSFKETLAVLKGTTIDRIGHGTFLNQHNGEQKEMEKIVLDKKIPLEICLTSNVKSTTVKDYKSNHLQYWFKLEHPVILCTDGKGVYQCSLSDEYFNAAMAFNLTNQQLWYLSYESINYIFAGSDVQAILRKKFENEKKNKSML